MPNTEYPRESSNKVFVFKKRLTDKEKIMAMLYGLGVRLTEVEGNIYSIGRKFVFDEEGEVLSVKDFFGEDFSME